MTNNTKAHFAIHDGCCIYLNEDMQITYAGPISCAPSALEMQPECILLSPKDHASLEAYKINKRNGETLQ